MKKNILMSLFLMIGLFVFSSTVKADTEYNNTLSNYYQYFDYYLVSLDSSNNEINDLLSYYNQNYAEIYPYYAIFMTNYGSSNGILPYYILQAYSSDIVSSVRPTHSTSGSQPYRVELVINIETSSYPFSYISLDNSGGTIRTQTYSCSVGSCAFPVSPYHIPYLSPLVSSNFDYTLTFDGTSYDFDSINMPAFVSTENPDIVFQNFAIGEGGLIPSYESLYEGTYTPSVAYTTINLNNYSYVALSLRDYSVEPFDTTFMVEGQLCLTPVYDYGMKEKVDYYSGYQVDRCSPVYSTSTPNRVSILSQDLTNHAIYYLKAFDTSINNIIKVDSNVFDITPISSSNENNPSVIIGGRSYPTIPYSQLSSSSTQSEEEGYISGESKNLFDITGDSDYIDSIFSNPLQTLKTTWQSITLMFALIGDFIGLLPTTLQAFLFTAFALGLSIGLIKLILG